MLELAEVGDHRNTDMLVRDIYGGDYKAHGLDGELLASAFGKVCDSAKKGQGIIHNILWPRYNTMGTYNTIFSFYSHLFDNK